MSQRPQFSPAECSHSSYRISSISNAAGRVSISTVAWPAHPRSQSHSKHVPSGCTVGPVGGSYIAEQWLYHRRLATTLAWAPGLLFWWSPRVPARPRPDCSWLASSLTWQAHVCKVETARMAQASCYWISGTVTWNACCSMLLEHAAGHVAACRHAVTHVIAGPPS